MEQDRQQRQQLPPPPRPAINNTATMLVDIKEYSGDDKTYPLSNWLQNIKVAHRMNKWNIDETRDYVLMRAVGKAGRKLQALPPVDTIDTLLQAINAVLKDETAMSTAIQDAMKNGQRKNETLQSLGDRVRAMMVTWGGEPFNERLAIEFFMGMLACKQTRFNIACNKKQLATLAAAVTHAEDYQANLRAMFGNDSQAQAKMATTSTAANFSAPALQHAINTSTEDMDISAMNRFQGDQRMSQQHQVCFYCDKPGHIGIHCALLAKHKRLIANYENRIRATAARGRGSFRAGRGGTTRFSARGRGGGQSRPYQRSAASRGMPRLQEMEEIIEKMREMEEEGVFDDTDFVNEEDPQEEMAQTEEESHNDEAQASGFQ